MCIWGLKLSPQKAKVYTDLSLFTCDPKIANDIGQVFNSDRLCRASGYEKTGDFPD